ncbi:cyclic-phosphate processing receiver domain-containing protein [Prescottella agglutinans]|uniref:Cyclic-phosphate processing Receiver domain-containing protein n=1 Tax=Prescottella agglutinans TaxID=1644129 RepID=A0ABT6MF19_9NOCA|nr:cyclic-phosphate processing receiver domain-containing protein [Prescottella agglutinans]MDH6282919.1 hypothetical protein [Prescottella agglutinans]
MSEATPGLLWVFVDDERPAPKGWELAETAEHAIEFLDYAKRHREPLERLSLDHDLGYTQDTVMPVLFWMRDNNFWPDELYVHTANEDAEEVMLGFIHAHAPAGVLRGWGCNYWGTGPDSVERNEVFERAADSPAFDAPTGTPLEVDGDTIRIRTSRSAQQ